MISQAGTPRYAVAQLAARYEKSGVACGRLAIALGSVVMFGWIQGIVSLTNIAPQWVAMQPNTALCLILSGLSLLAATKLELHPPWRIVQLVCATIVFGIGLATLLEYCMGWRLGIDQFFHTGSGADDRLFPGRMAIATATNFVLTGAALAALDTRARALSQLLALLAMSIATLALLGYAYGVAALYDVGFFSTMALHTALGTLLVGAGVLLVRPRRGVISVLVSGTVGGVLARRLLPLSVLAPFLLGWVRIEGERRQWYDSSFGVAMTSVTYVTLFSVFTWRTAEALRHADSLRLDAEFASQAHAAQLNGLVESAMDAIVVVDSAQRIIVFNPAAELMFGYARASILGSRLETLFPQRFHDAHEAQLQAFGVSGSASRRMGGLGSVTALRADGTEFPTEASISHFNLGRGMCYSAIVRDITERVRVELALHDSSQRERERSEELRKLLFAVPAAVCVAHDDALTGVTGNALYERWFLNGANAPAVLSDGAAALLAPTPDEIDVGLGQAALRRAATGVAMYEHEFKHVHADGTVRYLFGNAIPLLDQYGSACGAISAFVDVTALKLSELAMLSVTAGSVAKSDYITHLTHELRTPLGTMLGYAQVLEAGALLPAQQASIQQIIKAGWYLNELIAEVQDLAAIEANAAGALCETVSLDGLLKDLGDMIAPMVATAGLRVTLAVGDGLEILANPVRIKQVLLNLLSNAIKYNRRGGSIEVSCAVDGRTQVRIGVRDSGHGLTPRQLASLFQPFNRLGQEHGEQVGTGVGLVVTKKLLESMGGTIGVESEVGAGSLFWFKMPLALSLAPLSAT